ncbi:hypothetical protein MJC1_04161 [Methylocystis sp. MJC1]|nr:hypothetical protein MJC1_04161 [Methylocystis sp. MJC1]
MNVVGNSGVLTTGSESRSATSRILRHVSFAVAAVIISLPAFAEERSRDLATFFNGRLTAKGQFRNFHDGSTRGLRVCTRALAVG